MFKLFAFLMVTSLSASSSNNNEEERIQIEDNDDNQISNKTCCDEYECCPSPYGDTDCCFVREIVAGIGCGTTCVSLLVKSIFFCDEMCRQSQPTCGEACYAMACPQCASCSQPACDVCCCITGWGLNSLILAGGAVALCLILPFVNENGFNLVVKKKNRIAVIKAWWAGALFQCSQSYNFWL